MGSLHNTLIGGRELIFLTRHCVEFLFNFQYCFDMLADDLL